MPTRLPDAKLRTPHLMREGPSSGLFRLISGILMGAGAVVSWIVLRRLLE